MKRILLKNFLFSSFICLYLTFSSFVNNSQLNHRFNYSFSYHKANTLKIWINAFIPEDLPGLTFKINVGSHAGKSAISGPFSSNDSFLTDQRTFSEDRDASYRMQSFLEIDLTTFELKNQTQSCGKTVQVNVDDGMEECTNTADTSEILINNYSIGKNATGMNLLTFTLVGSGSNPCFIKAPSITWNFPITLVFDPLTEKLTISFEGFIKAFPAYEMYAQIDDNNPVTIFQRNPEEGDNAWSLLLSPEKEITVIMDIN